MNLIVVGADGFIGRHLAAYFKKQPGCTVHTVSRSADSLALIGKLCSEHKIDTVLNATGSANVAYSVSHPEEDFKENVLFHFSILNVIKDADCRYIYFSSAAVYGNPQQLPVSEDAPVNPLSPYGWHKYYAEKICTEFSSLYKVRTASLRLFSVYGPGQAKMLFFDLYNKCSKTEGPIELQGSPHDSRDFIYIDDMLEAVEKIISFAPMHGECYNVASGNETSIESAAAEFVKVLAPEKEISFSGKVIPGYPANWRADISRINNLGFTVKTPFKKGLEETAKWLKENA